MNLLAFLIVFAAQAPDPGELQTFGDWVVGCDNIGACHAVALAIPEGPGDGAPTMSLRRAAGEDGDPVASFDAREDLCGASFAVDGGHLPLRLLDVGECRIVHPDDMPALEAALGSGRVLTLADPLGRPIGQVSLDGATAAMLAMDEAQGRVGTPTALVRRGDRPRSSAPPPRELPIVRLPPEPEDLVAELDEARIEALRRAAGCTIGEVGGPDEHVLVPLETGASLLLLACGSGAYNVSHLPFIVRQSGAEIAPAPFDWQWGIEELGRPTLINAEWDHRLRILTEFSRGRGLGDCGTRSDYAWDGTRFRLVRQRAMSECRGARDFITVWRARVARP